MGREGVRGLYKGNFIGVLLSLINTKIRTESYSQALKYAGQTADWKINALSNMFANSATISCTMADLITLPLLLAQSRFVLQTSIPRFQSTNNMISSIPQPGWSGETHALSELLARRITAFGQEFLIYLQLVQPDQVIPRLQFRPVDRPLPHPDLPLHHSNPTPPMPVAGISHDVRPQVETERVHKAHLGARRSARVLPRVPGVRTGALVPGFHHGGGQHAFGVLRAHRVSVCCWYDLTLNVRRRNDRSPTARCRADRWVLAVRSVHSQYYLHPGRRDLPRAPQPIHVHHIGCRQPGGRIRQWLLRQGQSLQGILCTVGSQLHLDGGVAVRWVYRIEWLHWAVE